jgi:hypothetical protein
MFAWYKRKIYEPDPIDKLFAPPPPQVVKIKVEY